MYASARSSVFLSVRGRAGERFGVHGDAARRCTAVVVPAEDEPECPRDLLPKLLLMVRALPMGSEYKLSRRVASTGGEITLVTQNLQKRSSCGFPVRPSISKICRLLEHERHTFWALGNGKRVSVISVQSK